MNPILLSTPFASSGDKNTIPESDAPQPQNATWEKGFPPLTQTPISEGGVPPERNDFNGTLNAITQNIVFQTQGGRYKFDPTYANKIGGYPVNAVLQLESGAEVINKTPNNTTNPNVDMTGWKSISGASGFSHLMDFGCKPNDPNFDNSLKIKAALESGGFINFGSAENIYYVKKTISVNLSKDLFVISGGAKIEITSDTDLKYGITVNCNGFNVGTIGRIEIDCKLKSFSGLHISNTDAKASDVLLNQIVMRNCRRSSTQHTGGDGIYIIGNVDSVIINQPMVKGMYMAAGAGVSGSQGISGITVVRSLVDESYIPKHIVLNEPHIEDVMSEDLDYYADQDGIKVFTRHSLAVVLPSATTVVINNPYFKNCLGRAFKSQAEIAYVNNPVVFRDIGFTRGYGNPEFDFQTGGGLVSNGHCVYKNTRPLALAYIYASESGIKNSGLQVGGVRGLNVSIEYDTPTIQSSELLRVNFYNGSDNSNVFISGVDVKSVNFSVANVLQISRVGDNPRNVTVTLADCSAPITPGGGVLNAQDTFEKNGLEVKIDGFVNTLNNDAHVVANRAQNFSKINTTNCRGLLKSDIGSGDLPVNFVNSIPEYGVMPVVGDRRGGGNVRFSKHRLTPGLNTIDIGGYANGIYKSSVILVAVARTKEHTAILATDNSGCIGLVTGSEVSVGNNAPSSAPKPIDIYVTGGNTLNINNTIGTLFATIQMLG